jgi:hypothetical protein
MNNSVLVSHTWIHILPLQLFITCLGQEGNELTNVQLYHYGISLLLNSQSLKVRLFLIHPFTHSIGHTKFFY